jgi:acetolactate synthase-1/2/3 large subunit
VIKAMIEVDRPVICDVVVDRAENVYPMIPGGSAHNEIRLCPEDETPVQGSEKGMVLV